MPPLAVRLEVARRQFDVLYLPGFHFADYANMMRDEGRGVGPQLEYVLEVLFGDHKHALDHDPALILRPYNPRIKDVAARYTPHAHDPAALVYRLKEDHQQKTTGRKPGALRTVTTKGSDIGIKTKFARLESKKAKRKVPIRSRGFEKGQKKAWPKRSMRGGRS